MTELVFYVLAGSAVLSALACILQRNPVAAAMWLVGTMFALSAIYVLLNAPFIGAIQVLVYAGAIMVLFLFVIMLLNLGREATDLRRWTAWIVAGGLALGLASALLTIRPYTGHRLVSEVTRAPLSGDPLAALKAPAVAEQAVAQHGVVGAIAVPLFQTYLAPFEITSVLLLAAAVGAVVVAKRRI